MADQQYNLILFISGMSVKSGRAIENIERIVNEFPDRKFNIRIVDVNKERDKAAEYQLFALPSLYRLDPKPTRTILGDLSDREKILKILEIT